MQNDQQSQPAEETQAAPATEAPATEAPAEGEQAPASENTENAGM